MTFRRFACLLILPVLAACGSESGDSPLVLATRAAIDVVRPGEREPVVDARQVLTPELIAGSPTSALLAVHLETDRGFTLIPESANLGTVQWRTGENEGILRRDGIIVGTRGFGHDLYTADVAALDAAFDAGGARDALRINRYLTAEGVIEREDFICEVRLVRRETLNVYGRLKQTRVFEEDCRQDGGDFVNTFWVEADGTVRKSIERISPQYGRLEVTRLTE